MFQVLSYIGRKRVLMSIFSKKNDSNTYGSSYDSTPNSWSSSSLSQPDTNNNSYEPNYDIRFNDELSNGALILNIIDEDDDVAGHITVSSTKIITVFPSEFWDFSEEDKEYLKEKATRFANSL